MIDDELEAVHEALKLVESILEVSTVELIAEMNKNSSETFSLSTGMGCFLLCENNDIIEQWGEHFRAMDGSGRVHIFDEQLMEIQVAADKMINEYGYYPTFEVKGRNDV